VEHAIQLGFPPVERLSTDVWGLSWDPRVYTGFSVFQAAKGFDPDSRDVAQHLGWSLYEISSETLAHREPKYVSPVLLFRLIYN
jgi:hypothetical protein